MRREGADRAVELNADAVKHRGGRRPRRMFEPPMQQPSPVRWVLNSGGGGGTYRGAWDRIWCRPRILQLARVRAVRPPRPAPVNPGPPPADKTKDDNDLRPVGVHARRRLHRPDSIGTGEAGRTELPAPPVALLMLRLGAARLQVTPDRLRGDAFASQRPRKQTSPTPVSLRPRARNRRT
jgi:hypothetical protein